VTATSNTPLRSDKIGFFIDLQTVTGGLGYEVVNEADALDNLAVIAAVKPSSDNACSPGGISKVFLLDLNGGGITVDNPLFAVDNVRFIDDNGTIKILVQGKPGATPGNNVKDGDYVMGLGGTVGGSKRLINWREIPLRN